MQNCVGFESQGESRYQASIESVSGFAICILNPAGVIESWNAGGERAKGYLAEEIIGKDFSVFFTEEDRQTSKPARSLETARLKGRNEEEGWRVRKDGSLFWASMVMEPVYQSGRLTGFSMVTRDISAEREAEQRLAEAHRNLDVALRYMSQGLALYDADGRLILANQRLAELFGVLPAEIRRGMPIAQVMSVVGFDDRRAQDIESRTMAIRPEDEPDQIYEEVDSSHSVAIATRPMPGGGWVTTFEDVTERRKAEIQLAHMAHHDALTGLPNRSLFRERLRQAMTQAQRNTPFALLTLDLNDFKFVNDSLGHGTGDELLRSVARRLQDCVREVDTVARLGGDEFAIIQSGAADTDQTDSLAKRLIRSLQRPYLLGGHNVISGSSIGIALAPKDGLDIDELLKKADMALYRAKSEEEATYRYFDPNIDTKLDHRRSMERDLRQALVRQEFEVHYQAMVSAQSGDVTSYEALVRWRHPVRGLISPAEFIPLAEESGLIGPIGEWVLRTACMEAMRWEKHVRVSVNLSPAQFRGGSMPEVVANAILFSGLEPDRLELEVTESVLLQNSESTLKSLYQLRELGVKIALDDFGTGYSSLSYLRNFPFDKLKIDRSFVQDLPASESARAIVEAITGLGASFKMSITAEGVEKQEQMDYLSAEGCQELQGFFIGRPKPASQLMQRSRCASAEAEETPDPVFPATLESTETVSMAML